MRRIVVLAFAATWLIGLSGRAPAAEQNKPQAKPHPHAVQLFDGKSLHGWGFFLVDPDAKMEDVWSVRDGILICRGQPHGYLATEKEFKNFQLLLQWRWAPGKKPGNSGVLLRVSGEKKMLPNCTEAQLKSGDAGDMYGFQGFQIDGDPARKKQIAGHQLGGDMIALSKIQGAEHEPGQWNQYRILVQDDKITLFVNDKLVNRAHGCDVHPGKIALQSEGGEIHFKNITLTPLD